jgi:hypothetical protein
MKFDPQKKINICSDPILKERLSRQGIDAHTFDAVLNRDEKIHMLESLRNFASHWFLSEDGVDYTEYRNISTGAAIHDEVMTLLHLLTHFVFVIDKLDSKNEIIFYHSTSCLMPDVVVEFLNQSKVTVKLEDEKYPWLSYKEQLDKQAKSNFSRIPFNHNSKKYIDLGDNLRQLKLTLRQGLSRNFYRMFKKTERNIYFHAHRSLIPFYESYINNSKNRFGIYITDTTALEAKPDKRKNNIFKDIRLIFHLAQKGVILDSLRCPFYYNHSPSLISNFPHWIY